MFRAHVLIIRRSKLHYTASGIITPIGVMIQKFCASSCLITEINVLQKCLSYIISHIQALNVECCRLKTEK